MSQRNRILKVGLVLAVMAVLGFAFCGLVLASSAGNGEGAASHDGGDKLMDLLARFINFAVLAGVMIFLLRKPIKNFFSGRSEQIRKDFEELDVRKIQAQEQLQQIRKKLDEIEQERDNIIAQFVKEGEAEKKKIIDNAKAVSERIEEQAQLTIQQEIQKAKDGLKEEISELATRMAEEIISKNIQPDDEDRLIKEYIQKVTEAV